MTSRKVRNSSEPLTDPDPILARPVAGVDEAGRGPLAGPVVAAAVVVPDGWGLIGLNDSKKLSASKREALVDSIKAGCLGWGIGVASAEEIDQINILQATFLAMRRALDAVSSLFNSVVVDGNKIIPGISVPQLAVVEGDGKILSIAAASILAKTHRDQLMVEMDREYPGYGFAIHMGYPTPKHQEALVRLGVCPQHRKTFGPVRRSLEQINQL